MIETASRHIVYAMLIIYLIAYLDDKSVPNKYRDRIEYIPKRNIFKRTRRKIMSVLNTLATKLEVQMNEATTTHDRTRRTKINSKTKLGLWTRSKYKNKYNGRKKTLTAMSILALSTTMGSPPQREFKIDTDSTKIGVDNRCSACITDRIEDFVHPPKQTNRAIKGFGGIKTQGVMVGTIRWEFPDDEGKNHAFEIPNSYYAPTGQCRLLSPQHWAKAIRMKGGGSAGETTTDRTTTLFWKGGKHKLTIPLDKNTNVATFSTAPGYNKYSLYCQKVEIDRDEDNLLYACDAGIVSDDEVDQPTGEPTDVPSAIDDTDRLWTAANTPHSIDMHFEQSNSLNNAKSHNNDNDNDSKQLLTIHQQMNHISFNKLKEMAKKGIIPNRLAKCRTPLCSSCSYAKIT